MRNPDLFELALSQGDSLPAAAAAVDVLPDPPVPAATVSRSSLSLEERKARKRARNRAYRERNLESERARVRAYREKNLESVRAKGRAYRERNLESERARVRAYREKNLESVRAKDRAYRERNRGAEAARVREYRESRPFYRLWLGMRQRCYDPSYRGYRNYGGRGIQVYEPWRESFVAFDAWIRDNLGPKPSPKHSLDRIDNDGSYEPGNLRWATKREQAANRRPRHLWRPALAKSPASNVTA